MRTAVTPVFEQHRVFHSRNVDEARAFLHGKEFRLALARRDAPQLDLRINGVYLPNVYVGYIQYGTPVSVRAHPTRSDYWLQVPLRGKFETTVGYDTILCSSSRAAISSPSRGIALRSDAGSARLNLSISRDEVVRQLVALLGRPFHAPLEFAPDVNLGRGYGRSLARYLRLAAAEFERGDSILFNPLMQTQFEQFIIVGLLVSHPHNCTEALRRSSRIPASRDIKRAIDYMQGNLQAPITIADIASASRLAGRTLFQHFRAFAGTSPMQYVRNARFEKVHESLLRATPGESVTGIASAWGFAHMGRFAIEYRKHFGESPSETLRGHVRPKRSWRN
jgi:AraC-like DNA-binding protein